MLFVVEMILQDFQWKYSDERVLDVNDEKPFVVAANCDDYDEICLNRFEMVEEEDRRNQLDVFQYPIDKHLDGIAIELMSKGRYSYQNAR